MQAILEEEIGLRKRRLDEVDHTAHSMNDGPMGPSLGEELGVAREGHRKHGPTHSGAPTQDRLGTTPLRVVATAVALLVGTHKNHGKGRASESRAKKL